MDGGYGATAQFQTVKTDVNDAVSSVHWPENTSQFILNPIRKGNGVKPIKTGFVELLKSRGWQPEGGRRLYDAVRTFDDGTNPFAIEWETGNIASSHRAINRMAAGMHEGLLSGGILVVPTGEMYKYLTDRIGNVTELVRYFDLWRDQFKGLGYLAIVTVEHDSLSDQVPLIAKGTDGRALI